MDPAPGRRKEQASNSKRMAGAGHSGCTPSTVRILLLPSSNRALKARLRSFFLAASTADPLPGAETAARTSHTSLVSQGLGWKDVGSRT